MDIGTTMTIDNPVYVSSKQRYITTDAVSFTIQSATTFALHYKTQYFIEVNSNHGTPTASAWVDEGAGFTAAVTSPTETVINDQQWVCTGYSVDGGSASSGTSYTFINVQATHTILFNWKKQFWIQVNSTHGIPTLSAWVDEGAGFTAAVTSPTETVINDQQWVCTGYSVDGGSASSGTSYTFINVQATHTILFNWKKQFWIQVNSTHGIPTLSAWVDEGAGFTATVNSPAEKTANNSQWICTGYSIDGGSLIPGTNSAINSVENTHTIDFSWTRQFYLTVNSPNGSPIGDGWYDADTIVYAVLPYGVVPGETGVQYVFTGWGDNASGTGLTSDEIVMDTAKTATANWKTQYYLTTSTAYGATGGAGWYDSGLSAFAEVSTLTVIETEGTRHIFVSWGGDASGQALNSNAIPMNSPKTATANWKTQHYLSVSTDFGTVSPSNGWYDAGAIVDISATEPLTGEGERYVWNRWIGTGDGSFNGTNKSAQVKMDGPIAEVGSWKQQYRLTVISSYGTPTPLSEWFDSGTTLTASVDSPIGDGLVTKYVCTGWVGSGSVPESGAAKSLQFTLDQPSSISWKWENRLLFVPVIVVVVIVSLVITVVVAYFLLRRRHSNRIQALA